MDLTLDQLLASLEAGMSKSAEASEDEKDEKEEKKELPAFMKKDEGEEKKEDKKEDKEDKKDKDEKDDEEDEGQEKSASEAGAALAREIMTKVASIKLETQDEMKKQAQTAGKALADALLVNLQKKANAGDVTVMSGGPVEGAAPTKNQVDASAQVAEAASVVKPMLTGDGVQNHGTINEIFDAIVADALAQGAASEEQVHDTGVAKHEGVVEDHAVPNQVKVASEMETNDEMEKAAAVSTLVANGIDFEDAIALVKQASDEIEFEMEKSAALEALIQEGVDFDEAINLVKQASAGDVTVMDGGSVEGSAPTKNQVDASAQMAEAGNAVKPMLTGDGVRNHGTVNEIFDAIVADAMSQGAASEEQVHDTGVAKQEGAVEDHAVPNQVKVAAVNKMVEAGVDFEEAVEFVKSAEEMAKKASFGSMMAATKSGIKGVAAGVKGAAKDVSRDVKLLVNPASNKWGNGSPAATRKAALSNLGKNPLVRGAGAVAGVGAASVAAKSVIDRAQEKKAAFDALVDAGVDFEDAAVLVATKSRELYGE